MANARGLWTGVIGWVRGLFSSSPQTPPIVVEVDRPVVVPSNADISAIASLRNHPGIVALLNRLKLQQSVLVARLTSYPFKDLNDVNLVQSRLLGLRAVESEIRKATSTLEDKQERVATDEEVKEFEKALLSIESVGITSSEN